MFNNAFAFNQPIGSWNTSNVTNMSGMFNNASIFNQPLNGWNTSKVTTMASMFLGASVFNQPLNNWDTSQVTSMSSMFSNALAFNQYIGTWNTSKVTTILSMFSGARVFNNGESGSVAIPNITPSNASYINSTKTLTCTGATFLANLVIGDVLIIQTSSIVYSSEIQSITSNTTLILTRAFGSNISLGTITSIIKQVAGTKPLLWDTSSLTGSQISVFANAIFFNQSLTTNSNIWKMTNVTSINNFFLGTTNLITLFNNGQLITGTTAPMGWTFGGSISSTNYRTNSRLTPANKPAALP